MSEATAPPAPTPRASKRPPLQLSYRVADLQNLPPTVDVETAARLLGIGRTLAYELAKAGQFPCPLLRLGRRYAVPTAGLIRLLGADREA
jgi:predicted DNA-binding transcriptional regulator AlpA